MNHTIEDYIQVGEKFKQLKLTIPEEFSFLPDNIEEANDVDSIFYADSVIDLNKIFKEKNIPVSNLISNNPKYKIKKNADWYGPLVFISYTLFSENNALISVGLNVLSNYVSDFFKGSFGNKKIKLDIIIETEEGREYKKITYEGDSEGLKNVNDIIKSLKG